MSTRCRNPLSGGLIDVALHLVEIRDRKITDQVAFRRAVSSAYYAVFHALCFACIDGLGFRSATPEDIEPVYRGVEHARARDVFASHKTWTFHDDLPQIGKAFIELRRWREDADYSQAGRFGNQQRLLSRGETRTLIDLAKETVRLLDGLPSETRRTLAVLLLVRPSRR